MFNAVGGSTIHWSAHYPRYHPSDFRVRTLDGVGDDWPLTYDELEPYYDLSDRISGVAGMIGDPSQPPRSPRSTVPLPIGKLGETIARGFDRLGWHWWVSDSAIVAEDYDGRPACNLCGPCDVGCPTGARAQCRRDLLAEGASRRRRAPHRLPRTGDHTVPRRAGARRRLLRPGRRPARADGHRW